jgi:Rare lipoprotein B
VFTLLGEAREKNILSLSGTGRVREYQLRYRLAFRVHDLKGREFIAPTEVVLVRDISFSDERVLAKEQEEALLYRDMQNDMVQQLMRRLAAAKVSG